MESAKRRLIPKLVFGAIQVLILIYFSHYEFAAWVTAHLGRTYTIWLISESCFIVLFFYFSYYIFKIPNRLGVSSRSVDKVFKIKSSYKFKAIAIYVIPLLIGVLYFYYNNSLWFKLNSFSQNEVGVLIAEFREASLKEYLPQKSYSNLLKEKIPQCELLCLKGAPIRFRSTRAFFTSIDEANNYGRKINARIVIWGNVAKTEGVIRIEPSVSYPFVVGWGVGNREFADIEMYETYIEDWQLSGAPPDVENLSCLVATFLVLPAFSILKSGTYTKSQFLGYCHCVLNKMGNLPSTLTGILAFELGLQNFREQNFDSSLYYMKLSSRNFQISAMLESEKQWIVSYINSKISMIQSKR